jgi:hypothetical protein
VHLALAEGDRVAYVQAASLGRELAARDTDEGGLHLDGDDAERIRVEGARRERHRDVQQRHDGAAVGDVEAVHEIRAHFQHQHRAAVVLLHDLDAEMIRERDLAPEGLGNVHG